MVCTRDMPLQPESGRERTMRFIHTALAEGGELHTIRLESMLESKSLRRLAGVALRWFAGLLKGCPLPLQSLLFWDSRYQHLLDNAVQDLQPDAVYFDGVRSGIYLPGLKHRFPALRMVCDFDDLMSRRMAHLAREGQPLSLGYLKRLVSPWIQRNVLDGWVAKVITRYEERALRLTERHIMESAEAVVLVSSIDAAELASGRRKASVVVIPPMMPKPPAVAHLSSIERFVFVGSDSLLQNRKSIESLVALWAKLQPETELHLYGRQSGSYGTVRGVIVHGFVADLAAAYTPNTVMLAPSFVSGGVKTKVLEAFANGVIAVGTLTTFEGIEADTLALVFDDVALEDLVMRPENWLQRLNYAGARVVEQAAAAHAEARLGARWRAVLWGPATEADSNPAHPRL